MLIYIQLLNKTGSLVVVIYRMVAWGDSTDLVL
ncbi:hypothetical protein SAMN05421821_109150 [Mucilaginibacter lappiensis]|uniref:Uncharacterized protein n=1 Tax=Mucilaginibacter lappiensis TaxID=354630 RepID=A0ABR6PPC0_9SPHI|nr:hypothetical protein [Mucilaginibacter lappiensis]SIR62502.1 hypothetical protein SAMN05421821_109150 [Mucilaginibacter lappiensis]